MYCCCIVSFSLLYRAHYRYCIAAVSLLNRFCIVSVSLLHHCCIAIVLHYCIAIIRLSYHCCIAIYRYCIAMVPLLYHYCIAIISLLYRRFYCFAIVSSLYSVVTEDRFRRCEMSSGVYPLFTHCLGHYPLFRSFSLHFTPYFPLLCGLTSVRAL